MSTESSSEIVLSHEVAHLGQFLESINVRIARLSIALRVPLNNEAEIQDAIKSFLDVAPPGLERRSGVERRSAERVGQSPERRVNMQRSELRGLLVLRYETEVKLVEMVGATLSSQLIESVARNLERQGFAAGAGGALVNHKP